MTVRPARDWAGTGEVLRSMETGSANPKSSLTKQLNLGWLGRMLASSVGRKFVMAVTGLMLCGFLIGHLAGNLLLFGGPEAFDAYAAWIHNQEFLPLIELGLLLLFLAHIYLAVVVTLENRAARSKRYAVKHSKQAGMPPLPPHNWMFVSGAIVLGFVLLHLADLRIGLRPDLALPEWDEHHPRMYEMTVAVLSNPLSRVVYIIGTIFLGLHLSHGAASAFRSLGWDHPKYTPTIRLMSWLFAIVIGVGFCSLPILIPELAAVAPPEAKFVTPAEP